MRASVVLVLLAALLAVPASASALSKPRWKSPRITYADRTTSSIDRAAVKRAVKWWNDAPGPVKLVRASSTRSANITFNTENRPGVGYDGIARYALDRTGTYVVFARLDLNDFYLREEDPEYVAEVTAHELGHALGLPHLSNNCSLMYPSGSVALRCPQTAGPRRPGAGRFYCGPTRADVRSLLARYGGKLGDWPGTICTGSPPEARLATLLRRHG
jgi:hypothetical protein